jgi:predicted metal-dependent hydrolase
VSRDLHPILTPEGRQALFREGIDLFNRGEHYAAHEAWEEVWRSNLPEPRTLLQGLIQVAAGMHQFLDLHREIGPRRTLAKAAAHLEPYTPTALGLDVAGVLASVEQWRTWLETGGERPPVPELRVVELEAVQ